MAKKFNFRLESVLKLREQKVEEARDSLNQAVRIRLQKEEMLKSNQSIISGLRSDNSFTAKADSFQAKENYISYLEKENDKFGKEIEKVQEIENIRRSKLSQAMKEEKVLTKLKDKKSEDHRIELLREENELMDEISIRKQNNINNERE